MSKHTKSPPPDAAPPVEGADAPATEELPFDDPETPPPADARFIDPLEAVVTAPPADVDAHDPTIAPAAGTYDPEAAAIDHTANEDTDILFVGGKKNGQRERIPKAQTIDLLLNGAHYEIDHAAKLATYCPVVPLNERDGDTILLTPANPHTIL